VEPSAHNLDFLEGLYASYLEDPSSVAGEWQAFFSSMENGASRVGPTFARRSIFNRGGPGPGMTLSPSPAQAPIDEGAARARAPFLEGVSIFRGLPPEELEEIAMIAVPEVHRDGEVFVREGETGQHLFIVTRGRILVRRAGRIIAELGPREVVGEMAVLDSRPRSADAVAHGDVEVLRIGGADLLGLLERRPSVAKGIIAHLTQRLRDSGSRQDRVDQLIRAYRVRGHLIADLDPLGIPKDQVHPELNPAYYGFKQADLDTMFSASTIPKTSQRDASGEPVMSLRDIIAHLRRTYCRSIGVQFMHIDDVDAKLWLQNRMESTQNTIALSEGQQVRILGKLFDAEIFEQFIHKKFVGAKRFSLEGAESLIPLLDMAIENAGEHGVEEVVIGMAHRGRLNVLANVMGKSPRQIFREFDDADPLALAGKGDVKYHLGYSSDRITASGKKVHLSLTFNPSHLEFVSPVVVGRVRAKQDRFGDHERRRGLGIVIHGDAAFAGQGVVQETFNMSKLAGYTTGGTLHIIVNNQIGFTTDPIDSRSTQYCTDVAKMLQIPIIHVNGEHPEAVGQAILLASEFREAFAQDVVIDMYCYRRYGHNEGDEPQFTQPLLYKAIRKRKSVREGYLDNLLAGESPAVTREIAERIAVERKQRLEEELGAARSVPSDAEPSSGQGIWRPYKGGSDRDAPEVDTGVEGSKLGELLLRITAVPSGFTVHPKIEKLLAERRAMASGGELDWAAAEALAFGTLLAEGTPIRLSGQDAGRGTFSHRHSVLSDFENGQKYAPLSHVSPDQGRFEVRNSPLTETGVIAFEYGYSLDFPEALVVWEAQFGDFTNVGQVIIDQFITSGEEKWRRLSSLVMLLPHGFEGQGPEHSSARLERFLAACAEDNIQVASPSTPAQLFHLLRRQVLRPIRKPLIVMSPKSLLRHPRCTSPLRDLARGRFLRMIPDEDPRAEPGRARRLCLTSGKLYYELAKAREELGAFDVGIARIDQLYPFRPEELRSIAEPYPDASEIVWVQEEPRNMGAWTFLSSQVRGSDRLGRMSVIARPESASPATGSPTAHKREQAALVEEAFTRRGVT
jgi:2-oxoglutarate dehydrogenase E1 component